MGLIARRGLLLLCLVLVACLGDSLPTRQEASGKGTLEIRLDVRPFTEPTAVFVRLDSDGRSGVVRYSPTALVVVGVQEQILLDEELDRYIAPTRTPLFRAALQGQNFGGTGLTRGDQFHLSLESGGSPSGESSGFVGDAPEILRSFIDDLLDMATRLDEAPTREAYLRSEPVEKERFERIQEAGRLRILTLGELPSELRPIVSSAARRPLDFHGISRTQYEELLSWVSHGHELFVLVDGVGHQMTLFSVS